MIALKKEFAPSLSGVGNDLILFSKRRSQGVEPLPLLGRSQQVKHASGGGALDTAQIDVLSESGFTTQFEVLQHSLGLRDFVRAQLGDFPTLFRSETQIFLLAGGKKE